MQEKGDFVINFFFLNYNSIDTLKVTIHMAVVNENGENNEMDTLIYSNFFFNI